MKLIIPTAIKMGRFAFKTSVFTGNTPSTKIEATREFWVCDISTDLIDRFDWRSDNNTIFDKCRADQAWEWVLTDPALQWNDEIVKVL